MASSHRTSLESRLTIEDTTLNFVNNTSGGAILQYNGSPTPADFEQISRIFSASLNGRNSMQTTMYSAMRNLTSLAANQAHAGPSSAEQFSTMSLAQLVAAIGSVTIRNSTVNGTNNTSGGLIVLINNVSQSASRTGVSEQGIKKLLCL
jgi:hypothetical protein